MKNEVNRIKEYYKNREIYNKSVYTYFNKGNLFLIQRRERVLLDVLLKYGFNDLKNVKILDVGCGNGNVLRNFLQYGAVPENLYGIDLLRERVDIAKKLNPNMHFICGNANNLPYKSDFFDIVILYTVFSSILDSEMKKQVSKEIKRVLKNDGIIIWYDMMFTNPFDKNIKRIGKKELKDLFNDCKLDIKRITLNPIIVRRLIKVSELLCFLLEKIKILNTHYFAVIRKI